ncbi:hypothetical protein SIIN_3299_T [Serendipita indica DSM 11827]|nr:hypothetical protein SIIN_3299_T [Serendipita indica DSM 11827]
MVAVQYSAPTSTLESYTTDTYLTGRLNPIPMDKVPPTIVSSSTATSTPGATLPQHEEDGSTGMHIGIDICKWRDADGANDLQEDLCV